MIFTARQLEQQYKASGQVTLPYRARLTPLAQDFIRQHGIKIGYADVEAGPAKPIESVNRDAATVLASTWMWWADGPCGPAKAALFSSLREANIQASEISVAPRQMVEAVKVIATEIKAGRIGAAIMLVNNGSAAMVYANRCQSLRAVLGTCVEAVEQGVRHMAANVLVIEHPYKTIQQAKQLVTRFARGKRELSAEVKAQLSELSSCE